MAAPRAGDADLFSRAHVRTREARATFREPKAALPRDTLELAGPGGGGPERPSSSQSCAGRRLNGRAHSMRWLKGAI
jgi:hypothetical protein